MFGNTVNTTSLLVNAVIINLIKTNTQSNVLIWKFKNEKPVRGRSSQQVKLPPKGSKLCWQWRARQQKIPGLKRGCRCLWHVDSRRTRIKPFITHLLYTYRWSCALCRWIEMCCCTLAELYKLIFFCFHNIVNEKEHNILKYLLSAARIVWINKSQICSCTHFSTLDPSKKKLSIN